MIWPLSQPLGATSCIRSVSPFRRCGGGIDDREATWLQRDLAASQQDTLADRAYDTNPIRNGAAARRIWANIPPRAIRRDAFSFSPKVYRQRNLVERFFNRIKQFRGIATRYDRRPDKYLAALRIWLACK